MTSVFFQPASGHPLKMSAKFMKYSLPTLDAISSAEDRSRKDRRSRLEKIPNEIKLMIVCRIPDTNSIFNLALTGPVYCDLVATHEMKLTLDMISLYIPGSIMHLAIATHVITTAPWSFHNRAMNGPVKARGQTQEQAEEQYREELGVVGLNYENAILGFCEFFRETDGQTLSQAYSNGLTLWQSRQFLKTHHAVRYYARLLASQAMELTPNLWRRDDAKATPTMLLRYEKALYIMQLVSAMFSWKGQLSTINLIKAWGDFWYRFYPWEVEQVFCVQQLLERHIAEVISEDINAPIQYPSMQMIARYVLLNGPWRLWELERNLKPTDETTLASHFHHFPHYSFHDRAITMGYAAPGFGLRVMLPRIDQKFASRTWRDDLDSGPMKLWYYLALRDDIEWTVSRQRRPYYLSDMRTMVYAGYALWDELPHLDGGSVMAMHHRLMRDFQVMWDDQETEHRAPLTFFRMTEPRHALGAPEIFQTAIPSVVEYCYLVQTEILPEAAEKRRQKVASGQRP
ncbi:hypothetical protein F5Y01DRAFT_321574 [Xylaria sp. FL0043]|nr:hypothetical protein F5Y01DRAFT_321574 [Xylaria sp. FL0043]